MQKKKKRKNHKGKKKHANHVSASNSHIVFSNKNYGSTELIKNEKVEFS